MRSGERVRAGGRSLLCFQSQQTWLMGIVGLCWPCEKTHLYLGVLDNELTT